MAVVTQTIQDNVTELYIGFFGRAPDAAGFGYWTNRLAQGDVTIQQISKAFAATPEFISNYNGLTPTQQVQKVYQNVLGRAADTAGLNYWVGQITSGTQTIADVVWNVTNSAFLQVGTADGLLVQNKVAVGEYFAITVASNDTASAATAFSLVTSNPASIAQAEATLVSTTYTLTTGVDAPGSGAFATSSPSGYAAINGTMVYTVTETVDATSTLNVSDIIRGTGSNNNLNLIISGAADAGTTFVGAGISGIQNFNVRNISGQTNSLDASTVVGLTNYNNNVSTSGALTVTNLASGASGTITGNGQATLAASNFGWAAAVTSGTLNLTGGTVGTGAVALSGTALASQTINSNGATANTIGALELGAATTSATINATAGLTTGAVTNNTAAALTSLTITGAGAVNLSTNALQSTLTTLNASANSGGVTVALGSNVTQTVTGGSGNDVITTGAVLTTGSVNAGTGTDTLVSGGITHINTAALGAKYTGFETLRFNGTTDASYIAGITTFQVVGGAATTLSNIATGQSVNIYSGDNRATSLTAASGTTNTLNLSFGAGGSGTGAAGSVNGLTVTGYSTLNASTNQGSTAAVGADRTATIGSFTGATLAAVNLTGTAFTISNIATTVAVNIDGSQLTGNGNTGTNIAGLTVAGDATAGSVITGSAVRDSFTLGTASAATYNTGLGNDLVSATAAQIGNAAGDPTVNGGGGTDTLAITSTLTVADSDFAKVTGFENLFLNSTSAVSVTLGTNAGTAFATGITVTSGTLADGATYAFDSATNSYANNVTLTLASAGDGVTTDDSISVTTGAGNDTVSVTATSWVGSSGGANGSITINTGSGTDTISLETGTLASLQSVQAATITAGSGADTITVTHVNPVGGAALLGNIKFTMANGDSTISAYDNITGFKMSDIGGTGGKISDALDFAAVGLTTYAATAVTGYTAGQLTVAVSGTGVVTFAGTLSSSLTLAQKIAAVADVVNINVGDSALFTDTAAGVTSTYVFNNVAGANDGLVQLVGVTGAALITTNNATTDNGIFIV